MSQFDSTIRLRQLNEPEVSGYVVQIIQAYLTGYTLTGTGVSTGLYYPLNSNPSGYVTSGQTGIFKTQSDLDNLYNQTVTYVFDNYYAKNNPSGFVSSSNLSSLAVVKTGDQTISGIKTFSNDISVSGLIKRAGLNASYIDLNGNGDVTIAANYPNGNTIYLNAANGVSVTDQLTAAQLATSDGSTYFSSSISYINGGNVGIGNGDPIYPLDVYGAIGNSAGNLNITAGSVPMSNDGTSGYNININTSQVRGGDFPDKAGDINISGADSNNISPGNITLAGGIYFGQDGFGNFTVPNLFVSKILLLNSKVGINTSSPNYTLDVNGSGNFSSGLYINGIPVSTGIFNIVYQTGDQIISGIKAFISRPTVNGTGVLLSGEASSVIISNVVYQTGDQTISGNKTFTGISYFKSGSFSSSLTVSGVSVLTGVATGSFVTTGQTGSFVTTSQTGVFVTTGQTGSFVTTSQTGNANTLNGQSGSYYLNYANMTGSIVGTGSFVTTSQTGSFITSGQTGVFITTGQTGSFITANQTGVFVTTGQTGQFYLSNNPSGFITGFNSGLYVQTGQTGSFITTGQTGSFITTSQTGIFGNATGLNGFSGPYYLNYGNMTGSIVGTGSFITNGQTGIFITTGQTGAFYPVSNPSGYITGFNSGLYIQTGQTGVFVTTGQTGVFSTSANLVSTGSNLQGQINSLSGTLTGNYVLKSATGIFVTTGQTGQFAAASRVVYTTGDQTISGTKTFASDIYTQNLHVNAGTITNDGGGISIQSQGSTNIDLNASSNLITFSSADAGVGALNLELFSYDSNLYTNNTNLYLSAGGTAGNNITISAAPNDGGIGGNVTVNAGYGDSGNGIILLQGGNVGIGNNAPSTPLHVLDGNNTHGTDIALFQAQNLSQGVSIGFSEIRKTFDSPGVNRGVLTINAGDGNPLILNDNSYGVGKVGIRTTSPSYTLDVNGSGNFKSGLYVSGISVLTGSTSSFVTTGQTGVFVTTGQTGSFVTTSQTGNANTLNGQSGSYYLNYANMTGSIAGTGLFVTTGQTGSFVTTSQTGVFVTTGQTGSFVTTSQTGNANTLGGQSGSYYLNLANHTGSLAGTGSFITTGQTGSFVTTSQTGVFVTTGQTGSFVTTSQTGVFVTTGQTGSFVTSGQTGSFVTTGYATGVSGYLQTQITNLSSQVVYTTGNQTISGTKTFTGIISVLSGNFTSSLTISGVPVSTGSSSATVSNVVYTTGNSTQTISGSLTVTGHFSANTKSFLIDHPTQVGRKLQYGSLESPYHGVRLTGKGKIKNGICQVELPEYIKGLVHQEEVNIQITNINHDKTLYVKYIDINNNNFIIGCNNDFNNNEYEFYWSFTAVRKDVEYLKVEI